MTGPARDPRTMPIRPKGVREGERLRLVLQLTAPDPADQRMAAEALVHDGFEESVAAHRAVGFGHQHPEFGTYAAEVVPPELVGRHDLRQALIRLHGAAEPRLPRGQVIWPFPRTHGAGTASA